MNEKILTTPVKELTDVAFDCECGHRHSVKIGKLEIGEGVSAKVPELAAPYGSPVLVVCDVHTRAVLGEKVYNDLRRAGIEADILEFPDEHLHPDAFTLGRLFIEASDETKKYKLLVAVGSGTINDVTRMVSGRLGLPYFIVGTAPSMDGYAGESSPIVCRGTKMSFYSHFADAIVADTVIMSQAPAIMKSSGFGDVLGKYVALADWKLGADIKGEYRCPLISKLMMNAVKKVASSADGVAKGDSEAVYNVIEGLILAGMCMGLAGVTRPASGCEHHITHYCDVALIKAGKDYPLHGNAVGMNTIAMLKLYELARQEGITKIETPPADEVRNLILKVGGPTHPSQLGISDELYREALRGARTLRPQYSMLKHVEAAGLTDKFLKIVEKEVL